MNRLPRRIILTGVVMLLSGIVAVPTALDAHTGATGIVKERMDAMKSMGDAMKRLAAMIKGEVPYDGYAVARDATLLATHGGDAMTKLFPAGSTQHPSEALPEIWKDWPRFKALADELQTAAKGLQTAAASGLTDAPKTQFREAARTCKACHDDFRERQ